jgi:Undecaprenyl-phosphate glucose phosphotransferase
LFLLNLAILLACYFDFGDIQSHPNHHLAFYMLQANLAWILIYFAFFTNNLYLRNAFRHRVFRIFRRIGLFLLLLLILVFLSMRDSVAWMFIFSYILVFFILETLGYWLIYSYLKYIQSRKGHNRRVLLVGYSGTSRLFREMIENTPMLGYKFVGYVKYDACDPDTVSEEEQAYVLGNTSQLAEIIKANNINVVFSVFSFLLDKVNINEQLMICNQAGIRMYLVTENQRWLRKGPGVESIGNFDIVNPQHIPLDEVTNRVMKRTFDLIFSSAIMLLFGWNVFPLVVLMIKLTSKGPVFFIQERTGFNNIAFKCYKFRSMYVNGYCDTRQATRDDARITPFGRFMRKWNIDELPQFMNVFCGQMSVVGPRPHMLKHTEQYSALINYYKVRHYVKPGVTGWAQVNGWRGETDEIWKMEKRVKYDMEYIENWAFLWDVKIIWLTVFGKNAWENAG